MGIFALTAAAAMAAAPAPAPIASRWREASTDHFVVYSQLGANALQQYATRLERFDSAMRYLRNVPRDTGGSSGRVTVYVVKDLRALQKLYGSDREVAGFYIPRAAGSVAFTPQSSGARGDTTTLQPETVLFHEYSHHFMLKNYPGAYPAWFREGFAEFHSTATFLEDGAVDLGRPAYHRLQSLAVGSPMPTERLVSISNERLTGSERESVYGRGWLLTHYLTFSSPRQKQLGDYLGRINRGETSIAAARAAFGDLGKLDAELVNYTKRGLPFFKISSEMAPIGAVRVRELSPAEQATIEVRMRSQRGVDRKQALALVPAARRAAAPFPNDAFAQAVLAEAEYDAGNFAEAEAAADRAIAADPKSIRGLLYKGRARLAQLVAAKSTDAAAWGSARKWFIAANAVDTNYAEPLSLFYQSFAAAGQEPTRNAVIGLVRALELAPYDSSLRWMAAVQHLRDGKGGAARAALAPLAYNPHGGAAAQKAASLLTLIDAGDLKGALARAEAPAEAGSSEGS